MGLKETPGRWERGRPRPHRVRNTRESSENIRLGLVVQSSIKCGRGRPRSQYLVASDFLGKVSIVGLARLCPKSRAVRANKLVELRSSGLT